MCLRWVCLDVPAEGLEGMENKGLFWFQMCIYSHMVLVLAHIPQDLGSDLWHCSLRLTWFWLPHSGFSLTLLDLEVQRSQSLSSKLTQCVKLRMTPCPSELFGWRYILVVFVMFDIWIVWEFHFVCSPIFSIYCKLNSQMLFRPLSIV